MVQAKIPSADSGTYPEDLELTLLQVVHRHGERTPVRRRLEQLFPAVWTMCEANTAMFATIAAINGKREFVPLQRLVDAELPNKTQLTYEPGSCYYGQLTNVGRSSMAALGSRLREIYINRLKFLPDVFDQNAVYIRSTDYPRTQESVQQLVAAGLYPSDKRPEDFTLQIRTRDHMKDNMFPNPSCYRLRQLSKEARNEVAEENKERFAYLTKRFKKYVDEVSLDSHPSANGILDTLASAKAHGFKLPEDLDEELLREMEEVVMLEWFQGAMKNQEIRRLTLGSLLGDIRDRMVARADGSDKKTGEDARKLYIYSGHDTTIAPLLISMDVFNKRWPPFSSSIVFELFKQKGGGSWFGRSQKSYVRVRFNDKIMELPACAAPGDHHSSGDKSLCTLEAFQKAIKDNIPDNWAEECAPKH
ncbi:hypothetical protein O0I10_006799 [Lichtheimia ornata]|uniref:Acid phosphatase n=1 Tax=Lichtheimia ornata TaxID=688661 RepID=A0AAD7V3K7_9FUNG|nr:uncharacterized protein O0I10_006799 [Lichtheimia ornata]KAJ8657497.1 hypothetical protein O0I10_006799 [Lichtheimia ornata]